MSGILDKSMTWNTTSVNLHSLWKINKPSDGVQGSATSQTRIVNYCTGTGGDKIYVFRSKIVVKVYNVALIHVNQNTKLHEHYPFSLLLPTNFNKLEMVRIALYRNKQSLVLDGTVGS